MRGVGMMIGALAAACCGAGPSHAEIRTDAETAAHFLFFSGTDIWRNGAFSHAGFLWSYQGLNEDGPVFKLLLNGGLYRYSSGGTEITGRQLMAAALPGWRWRREGFELTVFAGLDVQDHRFSPDDPGNRLRGTHGGVRGGFDVWYEPFRDGMVTAPPRYPQSARATGRGPRRAGASSTYGSAPRSSPAATTPTGSFASARMSPASTSSAASGLRVLAG